MSKIFIYPTDTVWGIGGNALSLETYEKIAAIKKSSVEKPVSLLFGSIEQLQEYVDLDGKLTRLITDTCEMEITYGIPKSLFKIELPKEPFESTEYICFRILPFEHISGIIYQMNAPLITTSLNLTGTSPICSEKEASLFWKKYCPKSLFISRSNERDLSGQSSSIILISGISYSFLREGRLSKEIRAKFNESNFLE